MSRSGQYLFGVPDSVAVQKASIIAEVKAYFNAVNADADLYVQIASVQGQLNTFKTDQTAANSTLETTDAQLKQKDVFLQTQITDNLTLLNAKDASLQSVIANNFQALELKTDTTDTSLLNLSLQVNDNKAQFMQLNDIQSAKTTILQGQISDQTLTMNQEILQRQADTQNAATKNTQQDTLLSSHTSQIGTLQQQSTLQAAQIINLQILGGSAVKDAQQDGRLDGVESVDNSLVAQVATIQTDITSVKQINTQQDAQILDLQNVNSTQSSQINSLNLSQLTQQNQITQIVQKNTDQDTLLANHSAQLATIASSTQDAAQNTRLTAIETKNTSQDTTLASHTTELANIENSLVSSGTVASNLQTQINAQTTTSNSQNTRLASLENSQTNFITQLTAITDKNTFQDGQLAAQDILNTQ